MNVKEFEESITKLITGDGEDDVVDVIIERVNDEGLFLSRSDNEASNARGLVDDLRTFNPETPVIYEGTEKFFIQNSGINADGETFIQLVRTALGGG